MDKAITDFLPRFECTLNTIPGVSDTTVAKKEEIYLHTYRDSSEARRAVFEYIEGWYNRKRIHSAIGYITPQQKEDKELKKTA